MATLGPLFEAAASLQAEFARRAWSFCFIGGLAVQAWGQARMTTDVDLSLLTGWGEEDRFLAGLEQFLTYREEGNHRFALRSRVALMRSSTGVPVDIALAAIPFETTCVRRAVDVRFEEGMMLRVCSATDLIVHKAFANRPLDWEDIDAILVRSGHLVDRKEVVRELAPLAALKEEPEIVDRFRALAERVERREREERGKFWGHQ